MVQLKSTNNNKMLHPDHPKKRKKEKKKVLLHVALFCIGMLLYWHVYSPVMQIHYYIYYINKHGYNCLYQNTN